MAPAKKIRHSLLLGWNGSLVRQWALRDIEGRPHQGDANIAWRVPASLSNSNLNLSKCLKDSRVVFTSKERRVNFLENYWVKNVLRQ